MPPLITRTQTQAPDWVRVRVMGASWGQKIPMPAFSSVCDASVAITTFIGRIFECSYNSPFKILWINSFTWFGILSWLKDANREFALSGNRVVFVHNMICCLLNLGQFSEKNISGLEMKIIWWCLDSVLYNGKKVCTVSKLNRLPGILLRSPHILEGLSTTVKSLAPIMTSGRSWYAGTPEKWTQPNSNSSGTYIL